MKKNPFVILSLVFIVIAAMAPNSFSDETCVKARVEYGTTGDPAFENAPPPPPPLPKNIDTGVAESSDKKIDPFSLMGIIALIMNDDDPRTCINPYPTPSNHPSQYDESYDFW